MEEKKFPEFWYDSNACWGWVKNMEDLQEKLELQTDPRYGGLNNKDEFLDDSKQVAYKHINKEDRMNFGTRIEHSGDKTLREFLVENDVQLQLLIDTHNIDTPRHPDDVEKTNGYTGEETTWD